MLGSQVAGPSGQRLFDSQALTALITGPRDHGKSTLCAHVAAASRAAGLDAAGLVSPARFANGRKMAIEVLDLRTGRHRMLAWRRSTTSPPLGLHTDAWTFDEAALAWGHAVLQAATPCDLLVIDELGPLELVQGQGWMIGLDPLRAGRYRLALVVVRPALLPRFREHLDGMEHLTLTVTGDNRDTLPGQIMAMWGDDR